MIVFECNAFYKYVCIWFASKADVLTFLRSGEFHCGRNPCVDEQKAEHQEHVSDRARGPRKVDADGFSGFEGRNHRRCESRRNAVHWHPKGRTGRVELQKVAKHLKQIFLDFKTFLKILRFFTTNRSDALPSSRLPSRCTSRCPTETWISSKKKTRRKRILRDS